jgi:hypothetical protein
VAAEALAATGGRNNVRPTKPLLREEVVKLLTNTPGKTVRRRAILIVSSSGVRGSPLL